MKKIFILIFFILFSLAIADVSPVSAAENRTINFNLSLSRMIPKNIHGINTNWYKFLPIEYTTTKEAITKPGFTQIRFPGGTVANYYDWANFAPNWGIIDPPGDVPDFVKGSKPYFIFHVKDLSPLTFGPAITAMGKEVTFVVNILTNTNAEIINGLQKLKDNGITVKRIEMGNELYFRRAPGLTETRYLERAEEINDTAKNLFPGVKTGVVIGREVWSTAAPVGGIRTDWNIPVRPWYDAVIIHSYSSVGSKTLEQYIPWVTGNENQPGSRRALFNHFINNKVKVLYPNKELWLTEWDLSEDAEGGKDYANTYAQSYYVYDFLLGALQYPIITVANHHSLNALYVPKATIQDKYFDPDDYKSVPNGQYSLDEFYVKHASFWPLTWIGKAFSRYNRFTIGTNAQNDVTAVYFYNTANPDKGSLSLINKNNSPIKISLNGISLSGQQLELATLAESWDQQSTEANEFNPTTTSVTPNSIVIPAYAIAYISSATSPTPTSTPTITPIPTPTPGVIPGDLDGDGDVDIDDWEIMKRDFGKTGSPGWIPADIIKNGKVDIFDYNILVGNYDR